MEKKWSEIINQIEIVKLEFNKSYKCLNKSIPIGKQTVTKHLILLTTNLNTIRGVLHVYYEKLTTDHKKDAYEIFRNLRDRLLQIAAKHAVLLNIPNDIGVGIEFDDILVESLTDTEEQVIIENPELKMSQTNIEYLNIASKLIPEFDGRAENLQSFLAALNLADLVCADNNQSIAIGIVKSKLKGNAINLIKGTETNLKQIIESLKENVKGESVEVITAKLMNIRQNSKSANTYIKEVEDLTRILQSAYVSDGLSPQLAETYSTRAAVKAITKNSCNDKVRIVMEAGQFNNMNEAVAKFVNCCTEMNSHQTSILYYKGNNKYNRNDNFRGRGRGRGHFRGRGRGRGNYNNHYDQGNNRSSNRGRSQGNVRLANNQLPENGEFPLMSSNQQ